MTTHGGRPLHVLNLTNPEILLRSITSIREHDKIRNGKTPISTFSAKPQESVDLFTHIDFGEAIRLGWGRAVARGKEKGRSRQLHGWLALTVEDAQGKGGTAQHTPQKYNRHHVDINAPINSADFAKHRHHLAASSTWCEHPRDSFRVYILDRVKARAAT